MQRVCPCRATRTRWPRHGTRGSRRVPGAEFRLHLRGARAPGTRLQDLVHEKAACTPIRGLPSLLPAPGDEWRLGQKFRAETKVTSFRCANPIPRHRQFTDDPAIRRADGRKGQRDPKHGSPGLPPRGRTAGVRTGLSPDPAAIISPAQPASRYLLTPPRGRVSPAADWHGRPGRAPGPRLLSSLSGARRADLQDELLNRRREAEGTRRRPRRQSPRPGGAAGGGEHSGGPRLRTPRRHRTASKAKRSEAAAGRGPRPRHQD